MTHKKQALASPVEIWIQSTSSYPGNLIYFEPAATSDDSTIQLKPHIPATQLGIVLNLTLLLFPFPFPLSTAILTRSVQDLPPISTLDPGEFPHHPHKSICRIDENHLLSRIDQKILENFDLHVLRGRCRFPSEMSKSPSSPIPLQCTHVLHPKKYAF